MGVVTMTLVPCEVPLVPCVLALVPYGVPLVPCVLALVPCEVPLVPCVLALVPCDDRRRRRRQLLEVPHESCNHELALHDYILACLPSHRAKPDMPVTCPFLGHHPWMH